MDIDAAILWCATRDESALKMARSLGVTERLLNGNAKAAWTFVRDYQEKYSSIPSVGLIVEGTGCVVKPPDVEEDRVDIRYVVDQLYDRFQFKSLNYGLGKSSQALENGNQPEAVEEVLKLAEHLRAERKDQLQIHSLGDVAPEVLAMYERVKRGETGVPFPWQTMTDMTLGMWPGTLTFFVARPGVGKTWTAVIMAMHVWKEKGLRVLIVSPELGRVELAERCVAKYGSFSYKDMVSAELGTFAEPEFYRVIEELKVKGDGLYILDDEDRLQPDYIEQAVDAVQPHLVVIDSLYMLRVERGKIKSGAGSKGDRMERVVETINWMRGLSRKRRVFAPEGLPVVGIHQLSRDGKVRSDAARSIKSGRGTGGLEDTVALSDALFWNAHNLFAMYQDQYMMQDRQLMYVPLKARRQTKVSNLVIQWDLTTMDFKELGTKVGEQSSYEDDDEKEVPY